MKNTVLHIISISLVAMLFTSCFKETDNWYTNTADYDGRFTVALTCTEYADDNTTMDDGEELWIYNSAANVENEIVVYTHVAGIAVRGKHQLTGTPADFKGNAESTNYAYNLDITEATNEYYTLDPLSLDGEKGNIPASATAAGLELTGIQLYARLTLDAGKLTPLGKTTIGGNLSDGVTMSLTLFSDYLVYESFETDPEEWANPNTPEYAWRVKEGSRANADGWEKHWAFDGYRYTGYPEDLGELPPIVEK